ncbi:hypothetical protein vBKpnAMK6_00461 [Klebsiella phage vB_Kpn_AM_K6]
MLELFQIANSSNLKGAMTRGRNFAQAAIDGEVTKRLGMINVYKAYKHPSWNQVQAQVQIADNSNLKGAMTRGRNFAQAAIDGEVMKRLGMTNYVKAVRHPDWKTVQAQV